MLQADPSFAGAHRELGKVYISLQKNEEAEKQLKQAIEADPQDAAPYIFWARFWFSRSVIRKACPILKKRSHDP